MILVLLNLNINIFVPSWRCKSQQQMTVHLIWWMCFCRKIPGGQLTQPALLRADGIAVLTWRTEQTPDRLFREPSANPRDRFAAYPAVLYNVHIASWSCFRSCNYCICIHFITSVSLQWHAWVPPPNPQPLHLPRSEVCASVSLLPCPLVSVRWCFFFKFHCSCLTQKKTTKKKGKNTRRKAFFRKRRPSVTAQRHRQESSNTTTSVLSEHLDVKKSKSGRHSSKHVSCTSVAD